MGNQISGDSKREQFGPAPSSTMQASNEANQVSQGQEKSNAKKTVYLIRHAETEENVKLHGLEQTGRRLKQFKLPKGRELLDGCIFLLMCLQNKTDARLSSHGREQICQMREILKENSFLETNKISVIVHSPLQRARETCKGLFGAAADGSVGAEEGDRDSSLGEHIGKPDGSSLPNHVRHVAELDCLREITAWENSIEGKSKFRQRVQALENWLSCCSENNIAVVGHSEYFMYMLGLPKSEKFKNCDVWKVEMSVDAVQNRPGQCCRLGPVQGYATHEWSKLQLVHRLPCFLG
uniref:Phosphoglycerate mutase n=1 Tax=Heterosigma akashiwo TaxID=2829 RepID=A0A7S3UWU4_HETAK